MARLSPEQLIQRILAAIRGWETHAPNSTFSRRTLEQFKAAMRPCLEAHQRVVSLRQDHHIAVMVRNGLLPKAMQMFYTTAFAVQGDPAHGRDGALNKSFGYTPERERRAKIRRAARRKRAKRAA
jgi:hypothetical protein